MILIKILLGFYSFPRRTEARLNYFVSNLLGKNKLCASLKEFQEFRGVWIALYQIYEEGTHFASIYGFEWKVYRIS